MTLRDVIFVMDNIGFLGAWAGALLGPWLFGRMVSRILDKESYILESVLLGLLGGCYLYLMYRLMT